MNWDTRHSSLQIINESCLQTRMPLPTNKNAIAYKLRRNSLSRLTFLKIPGLELVECVVRNRNSSVQRCYSQSLQKELLLLQLELVQNRKIWNQNLQKKISTVKTYLNHDLYNGVVMFFKPSRQPINFENL